MEQGILELIANYIPLELLIIVALVYVIGMMLKQWGALNDKYIPLVLWAVSIVMTFLWYGIVNQHGITITIMIQSVVYGTFIVAIAVYGNNIWKQLNK